MSREMQQHSSSYVRRGAQVRRLLQAALAIAMLALLSGCASVSLLDSWKNPSFPPQKFKKILVVGVTEKQERRQTFEDIFAGELKQQGVEALASYTFTGLGGKVTKEQLVEAVRKSGADAALTTRLVKIQQIDQVQPGYVGYYPGYYDSYPYPRDFYGFYATTVAYEPATVQSFMEATIESSLFAASTAQMVWSGTTSAFDPSSMVSLSKDLAKIVIKSLTKAGFL